MLRNYLKIAWRNLLRNKVLSFINIFGLAIGMTFAMLIGLWVKYELSFDTFHANAERLAVVERHSLFNGIKGTNIAGMLPLYGEFKTNWPDVKRVSRMDWEKNHGIMVGNTKFQKNGTFVDPDFLKMFTFPLVKGSMETALKEPNSIILTESLAKALFGNAEPLGKIVRIDNQYNMQVTAIARDVPKNSTIGFEFLAPYEFLMQNEPWRKENKTSWGNNFLRTVVELKEGTTPEAFSAKIKNLLITKDKNLTDQTMFLFPMRDWHLRDQFKDWINVGGKIDYVRLFAIIGVFVLLIACINFMNLSTARSEKRAKEVGIRKVVGSQRGQLIGQFLSESLLTTLLAFVLSLLLMRLLLPLLKDLDFEHVTFRFTDGSLLLLAFGVLLVTGLVAGSYPAFYLSSFAPVKVLKGTLQQGKGASIFRKVLVVSQFTISIGLIISVFIVFQQIKHAKGRSIGYDPNNLVSIQASNDLTKNYNALKQELLNTGYLASVSKASSSLTNISNSWGDFHWEGQDPKANISIDVIMTEWDYEKTAGLKFKQGRPFSRAFSTDSSAVILNEAAVQMMGLKNPVGKTIQLDTGGREFMQLAIVGVVENMVVQNPFRPVDPGVIMFNPSNVSNIFLRLKPTADLKKALAAIQPIMEKHNPALPFEYSFADEDFEKKFKTENQVGRLAGIFAGLAVFISCLGLFGLAAFMAERRTKEIGIRKVLGASVMNLIALLSKEFMVLVGVSCLIASPLAYWFMHGWLQKYEYRIDISWWVFAIAGALALVIALVTVSFQAVKAALANPVKSLRSE